MDSDENERKWWWDRVMQRVGRREQTVRRWEGESAGAEPEPKPKQRRWRMEGSRYERKRYDTGHRKL